MKAWISDLYSKLTRRKTCRFCKRVLRSRDSIALGAGPTCARKNGALLESEALERQGQMTLFDSFDYKCEEQK